MPVKKMMGVGSGIFFLEVRSLFGYAKEIEVFSFQNLQSQMMAKAMNKN